MIFFFQIKFGQLKESSKNLHSFLCAFKYPLEQSRTSCFVSAGPIYFRDLLVYCNILSSLILTSIQGHSMSCPHPLLPQLSLKVHRRNNRQVSTLRSLTETSITSSEIQGEIRRGHGKKRQGNINKLMRLISKYKPRLCYCPLVLVSPLPQSLFPFMSHLDEKGT